MVMRCEWVRTLLLRLCGLHIRCPLLGPGCGGRFFWDMIQRTNPQRNLAQNLITEFPSRYYIHLCPIGRPSNLTTRLQGNLLGKNSSSSIRPVRRCSSSGKWAFNIFGEGGLLPVIGDTNTKWPKRPEFGLVFSNKTTLKNPLSPNKETLAKVAAEGIVLWLLGFASCTKLTQRVTLSGRTQTQ